MRTIVFSEIELSKKVLEQIEKEKLTVSEAIAGVLQTMVSYKYKDNGVPTKEQKMFSKIQDKLEEATEQAELSDEQFDFLFDIVINGQSHPTQNRLVAPLSEYLEKLKLEKYEQKQTKK